jgi:hypothetical protein
MSPPPITGYRLDAVHTFQVRTLQALGYHTRVALSNATDAKPELATAFRVDVTVHDDTPRQYANVGRVEPGKKILVDCERFVATANRDVTIVFHLIPERLEASAVVGAVTISRQELAFLMTAQDHYVEYYRDDGFAAGVLYQCGAFNYEKFSKDGASIIQAPKVYVGAKLDTLISAINTSPVLGYSRVAKLRCSLEVGNRRVTWTEELRPYVPATISMRERAAALGLPLDDTPQFACFWGLCETSTLVPLTINRDLETGCIGIEHSLPPTYYGAAMTGKLRARTVSELARCGVFGEPA